MTAARTADPMSLDVRRILALVQVESERYEEAIENSRWVLARDPQFPYAHLWLGRALVLSGRPEEGIPVLQDNWRYAGYAYGIVGRRAEASALAAAHPEDPAGQMMVYAGLGDRDRTFEALARASKIHWWRAATWMVRPELKFLRQDPRYRALRKQMGLPEELTIGPAGGASGG
jgi:predicted Zn-dependent protease